RVQLAVVRHDQVGVAADLELGHVEALGDEVVELGEQHPRVHDHAVADHRGDVRVHHAAGDQVQLEDPVADDDRVAGVVAALVADHVVDLVGEQVGGLALALVPPLGADEDDARHAAGYLSIRKRILMWVWYSVISLPLTWAEVSSTSKPSMPRSVLEASSSALWAASRHDVVDTPTRSIVLMTVITDLRGHGAGEGETPAAAP